MPLTARASAPVSGVSPVTERMMIAMISSGTARMTENTSRSTPRSHSGPKPRAATRLSGVASRMPSTVPTHAISMLRQVCQSASGSFDHSGAENMSQR